jgi:hypothetical protein
MAMIENRDLIKDILKKELNIPPNSEYTFEPRIGQTSIGPDIRIQDKEHIWYIEIKHKADWNSVSRLLLYREIGEKEARLVLLSRVIPSSIRDQTSKIGIVFVEVPRSFNTRKKESSTHGKVTSARAWKVIYGLLKSNSRSIRNISSTENVSYAWSYQILNYLILQGIAERNGNFILLKNWSALFNAVAWERPLKDLEVIRIKTDFRSTTDLARTLTESDLGKDLVFCGYLASSLHFGTGIRSDLIQSYLLEKDSLELIRSDYSSDSKNGVMLDLFSPDRNVVRDSTTISGIRITSKEQTILDLAGMGYQSRDLLDALVRDNGTDW